jgi:methyl coenzyme M reductase subunit C-like uncharacterized protein (methanogenesis marker protein 7)
MRMSMKNQTNLKETNERTETMNVENPDKEKILVVMIEHDLDISDVGNFQEMMRKIELELVPDGRVVTTIFLNDEALSEEQEELYADFGLDDIASLRLTTEEPVQLALRSLNDTIEYLPILAESFENTAKQIRSGDLLKAMELLQESLELIQSFNLLIDGIRKVLMIDFYQIKLESDEGENFANLNIRLKELADEILNAAQTEEWHDLADLLEYEFSPLLYRYLGAIPFLVEAVEGNNRDKIN